MKRFQLLVLLIFSIPIVAQTGIGTTTPHASAKLEVNATNKGFLPPRVTLTSANDTTTITSPAEGLLVYNLGSVGLQAGYYYWNNANWTTIATASLSGDNVLSTNLVKLYQEGYSTAANKAPSSDGYSFTVPVSGRYEFNFNSTGWNTNGSKIKLTFNIRQGTTVLESDYHESTSSNVWVEYEGRVEVNLNAGITYNAQIVTSIGQRDYRDFDKIFYKQVAGNLPINQHMANRNFQLNNNYLSNDGENEGIRVDNSGNVGIGTATPTSKLNIAGGGVRIASGMSNTSTRPSVNTSNIGNYEIRGVGGGASQIDGQDDGFLRLSAGGGTNAIQQSSIDLSGYSATVPDMNSNIVMRTSGLERLRIDASGNVNVTGKITIGDPTGNVVTKVSGFANAGTFIQMENLKVTISTSTRSLVIAAVNSNFIANVSGWFGYTGGGGGASSNNVSVTTTNTSAHYTWGFATEGDGAQYNILDKTSNKMYRVIMMIGSNFNNNFISIERLF